MSENNNKIILDLCGGTGSWSKPYSDAGYDVRLITLPEWDVLQWQNGLQEWHPIRELMREGKIYGVLAAPPCTMFSFARTNAKKPRDLRRGMSCVKACLGIIWNCMETRQETQKKTLPLKFWALENPYYGFLKNFLGKPVFIFDPWEFGNGYQKKTALWGNFNEPIKNPVPMTDNYAKKDLKKFDMLASKDIHPESDLDRQDRRAITPAGFAKAFFDSNR